MYGYKVYINLLLYKLRLRHILPAVVINNKQIKESNEPLVKYQNFLVRESVANMLDQACKLLPKNYSIKILCGYRSLSEQERNWKRGIKELKKQFPNLSESEIVDKNRKMHANPYTGFGPHQTGGAIDITLIHNKKILDMGGEYMSNVNSKTNSKSITKQQRYNRNILIKAMKKAGFQNYPNEWWHWSFGDRAYATYKNKPFAIYGQI